MPSKKTIEQWERQRGVLIKGSVSPSKEVTSEDFDKLMQDEGFTGVDYPTRIKFLKDNGYPVNRKTLADHELSHKPKEEEEE